MVRDRSAAPVSIGEILWTAVVLVCAAVLLLVSAHGRSTPYANDVVLADALLHGHLWVDRHDTLIDSLAYHGRNWIIEGPVPALFLVPFVALAHGANQTIEALVFCLLALFAASRLLARLDVAWPARFLFLAFLFAGTDLWWCSMLGDVWFVAHSAAVAFTFLALAEAFGARRPWLVALWASLAFGSRFSMILALPLYMYLLARDRRASLRPFTSFGAVIAVALALWVARDLVQYGTWRDMGYTLFFHSDPWGQPDGSPFRLSYVPYEVWSLLMQAPVLTEWRQQAVWPIFKVDPKGIAITFTSPALVYAFLAPRRPLTLALWSTVVLVAAPAMFYYLNGWVQFGNRHALDFEPFLLVLMALAYTHRKRLDGWFALLAVWSIAVGTWGVWYWDAFVRTGD